MLLQQSHGCCCASPLLRTGRRQSSPATSIAAAALSRRWRYCVLPPLRSITRPLSSTRIGPADGSSAAAETVPGAFPGYPFDPVRKSVGSADYEQLRANWGECLGLRHTTLASPGSVPELQESVANAHKLRVVGSAHSFSHICDAPGGTLLSLAFLASVDDIDPDRMTVSAQGGVTIGELCRFLAPRGCALPNVASFPHLTFAGAAATGSHGSGIRNQGFQGQADLMDFVLPNGDIRRYSRSTHTEEEVASAAVNLGCLGPIATVHVDIREGFDVVQACYKMPLADYLTHFHDMINAHDSVSTFANFGDGICEWTFQRDFIEPGSISSADFTPPQTVHGGKGTLHTEPCRIYESDVDHPGTGVFSWHDGLHFFMHGCRDDPMPYIGLQSEWFVAIEDALPALEAAIAVSKHWPGWGTNPLMPGEAPVVIISELRQVAGDRGFMSPTPVDSLSIHFTFGHHPVEVMKCVEQIGEALAPFNARPHWGKLFSRNYMTKQRVQQLYPDSVRFVEMCRDHDPHGKFRNEWLEQMIDF